MHQAKFGVWMIDKYDGDVALVILEVDEDHTQVYLLSCKLYVEMIMV